MVYHSIVMRKATEQEIATLPCYSYTLMNDVSTCPTFGLVTGVHKKQFASYRKEAPLRAGSAMHEAFAAIRFLQFINEQKPARDSGLAEQTGLRLFGEERYKGLLKTLDGGGDIKSVASRMALYALETSGYEEDDKDKNRTMSVLQDSALIYVQNWDFERFPIWCENPLDPNSTVGIENYFKYFVQIDDLPPFLFSGVLDGLHFDLAYGGNLCLHDNKTSSNIGEAWLVQWQTSHQLTGYCGAATVMSNIQCNTGYALGSKLNASLRETPFLRERFSRSVDQFSDWAKWMIHNQDVINKYKASPCEAPKHTHSCNRFFRPCSLLGLCTSSQGMREKIFHEEMVVRNRDVDEKDD